MPGAIGQLRRISADNKSWRFTSDIAVNFWSGGVHNNEFEDDNSGGSFKQKNTTGRITGISFRASNNGELASLEALMRKTVDSNVPMVFIFASGEQWSAPVKFVIDEGGAFTSDDGKFTCDAYADNESGLFIQIA